MSEKITLGGKSISVDEVYRDQTLQCRVLEADNGTLFLEYLASVGNYKIDVPTYVQFTPEQQTAYHAGTLDLHLLIPAF